MAPGMHPFTKDREDFDRLGARTVEMLGEYLRALPAQPVDRVVPDEVRRRLMSLPMPEAGLPPEEILEFLRREIMPWPVPIGHRRSYGWVNSPPAPIAILADAVSTTMNSGLDGYDHSALFLMSSLGPMDHGTRGISLRGQPLPAADRRLGGDAERPHRRAPPCRRARGLEPARGRAAGRARAARRLHERGEPFLDPEVRGAARHRHGQPARDRRGRCVSVCGRTRCAARSKPTSRLATCRSPSSPAAGRRTPAPSTRWMRSPTSRANSTSGCTWTARLAPGPRSIPPMRIASGASRAPTRSP